ncbi:MAG: hypothetical protein H7Z20_03865 [Bdellovibrio sp.]|nr:hypothetical protein [Methylotenera sp.]
MLERLKSQGVNYAVLALAFSVGLLIYLKHANFIVHNWHWLLLISIASSIFASVFNYWRLLKITEAPFSTIAAAAQGYVELFGKASTVKPLKTPYQDIPCVCYRASVYANRENEDDKVADLFNIMPLEYAESKTLFTLDDGSAQCKVDPKGAEVIYFEARTWRKNDHRYVEEYLPVGKPIYVIGQLDTSHEVLDEDAIKKYLTEKLSDWKTNKQQLLNRFDQNRDGQIDLNEWAQARQEAREEVLAAHAMQANNSSGFTLTKPAGKLFLISAKSPQQLRASYKWWLIAHLCMLVILLAFYQKLT